MEKWMSSAMKQNYFFLREASTKLEILLRCSFSESENDELWRFQRNCLNSNIKKFPSFPSRHFIPVSQQKFKLENSLTPSAHISCLLISPPSSSRASGKFQFSNLPNFWLLSIRRTFWWCMDGKHRRSFR